MLETYRALNQFSLLWMMLCPCRKGPDAGSDVTQNDTDSHMDTADASTSNPESKDTGSKDKGIVGETTPGTESRDRGSKDAGPSQSQPTLKPSIPFQWNMHGFDFSKYTDKVFVHHVFRVWYQALAVHYLPDVLYLTVITMLCML